MITSTMLISNSILCDKKLTNVLTGHMRVHPPISSVCKKAFKCHVFHDRPTFILYKDLYKKLPTQDSIPNQATHILPLSPNSWIILEIYPTLHYRQQAYQNPPWIFIPQSLLKLPSHPSKTKTLSHSARKLADYIWNDTKTPPPPLSIEIYLPTSPSLWCRTQNHNMIWIRKIDNMPAIVVSPPFNHISNAICKKRHTTGNFLMNFYFSYWKKGTPVINPISHRRIPVLHLRHLNQLYRKTHHDICKYRLLIPLPLSQNRQFMTLQCFVH